MWCFDAILAKAREARSQRWRYGTDKLGLPTGAEGTAAARALPLSGTPAGTAFEGFAVSDYAGGAIDWIASGFTMTIERWVIARYVKRSLKPGSYRQPGDIVSNRIDRIGRIENRIGGAD